MASGPGPLNGWRVVMGVETATTSQTVVNVAHTLPDTPTFVLATAQDNPDENEITITADDTTLTLTIVDTQAPETISYIAAVD